MRAWGRVSLILCLLSFIPITAVMADSPRRLELSKGAQGNDVEVTVLSRDDEHCRLEIRLPHILCEEQIIGNDIFHSLSIPGGGVLGETGGPELPTWGALLALPAGRGVAARILSTETESFTGLRPTPMQPIGTGDIVIDESAYAKSEGHARSLVKIGDPGLMGGQRVVPVSFAPVTYVAETGGITVTSRLVVEFVFEGQDTRNDPRPGKRVLPSSLLDLCSDRILNWTPPAAGKQSEVVPGIYLVICPDDPAVVAALNPLLDWRRRQGHKVLLATTTETGTTTLAIRSYIQNIYNTDSVPLEYVLFVGDANGPVSVTPWEEYVSGYNGVGDHHYTLLEGSDDLADALVGRLSCRSVSELTSIVNKIIGYEISPPMDDPGWFQRAAVVGDPRDSGISTVIVSQWLKSQLEYRGYTQVDTIFGGDFPNLMFDSIDQGISAWGYRGFWGVSGFTASAAMYLTNGNKTPFAVLPTCDSGSFGVEENALSEALLRSPGGGAIGAIGLDTPGTHTRYNNCLFNGIWEGMLNSGDHRLGAAQLRGKLEMVANYGVAEPDIPLIWSVWASLMGDPATDMWTAVPTSLTAVYAGTISPDATAMEVNVLAGTEPVAGARVSLYKADEVLVSGITDASGRVALFLGGSQTAGEMLVTVTGHNLLPWLGTCTVDAGATSVAMDGVTLDDDAVAPSSGDGNGVTEPGEILEMAISLHNSAAVPALAVQAHLISTDPLITVLDNAADFGDIPAGGSAWAADDFLVSISPQAPSGHLIVLELVATSGSEDWASILRWPVMGANFVIYETTWSGPGTTLDPGESGFLWMDLHNTGVFSAGNTAATLRSNTPSVTVSDSSGSYTSLPAGGIGTMTDAFELDIDPACFSGHLANFTMELLLHDGNVNLLEFTLPIGTAETSDPLGPDEHGYYIFDDTDTGYFEAPAYQWVELDPRYGGVGTAVGLADFGLGEEDTEVLDLPFSFTYYGQTFDRISVCSNGWLSMGSTSLTHFRNFSLPCAGSPNPLIAPFWDNLFQRDESLVYYWHDEAAHRFVVQWSRMVNTRNHVQNFEVILLDPEVYTTPTGDGEIVFQYETVNNTDTLNGCATVGIQNLDGTDGLLYSYWDQDAPSAAPLEAGRALRITTVERRLAATCSIGGDQIMLTVPPDSLTTRSFNISNTGQPGSVLSYAISRRDPALPGPTKGQDKAESFYMDVLTPVYTPGATSDIGFSVTNDSPIMDWAYHVSLFFPTEVTVNSATAFTDTASTMPFSGGLGAGTESEWHVDSAWLESGDTFTASMNLSFTGSEGPVDLIYSIMHYDMTTGSPLVTSGALHMEQAGPYVILQSPNGGQEFFTGRDNRILFATDAFVTHVDLEIDRGLGGGWETLVSDLDATAGYFDWPTAGPISQTCRIRISDHSDPAINDTSTGNFTVCNPLDWLSVMRRSGEIAEGESELIQLELDSSELVSGIYEAELLILNSAGGTQKVTVSLRVDPFGDVTPSATLVRLEQNSPNPFNPRTVISFVLPAEQPVHLDIFDAAGRKVRTLCEESLDAGRHELVWDGTDGTGQRMGSGLYLYQLRTDDEVLTRKMVLLK